MQLGEKLRSLRKAQKSSQAQVAEELGISRSTLADYEIGTYEPGIEKLKLFAGYFKVSVDELIGRKADGKKFTSLAGDNLRILAITTDDKNRENIQYVPVKARAGYLSGYGDTEFISTLPSFNLPGTPAGTYRAFEIKGDSMPPINEGFIVIGRYVENHTDLKSGNRYIFITRNEGIVFKRLKRLSDHLLELHSDNPQYAPYHISIEEVIEAWSFYSFIGFPENYRWNPLEQVMNKLDTLEEKISSQKK